MNTFILISALAVGQQGAPATFHCPAPTAAKGDVKAGRPLTHTFELVNASTGTVTVTKVEAGCGCLRQGVSASTLAPGEKTKLALEVNTLTQPDGPNRWQVSVSYQLHEPGAAPRTGEVLLQITATLTREIAVNPPQLAFSTAGAAQKTLEVTDKRPKPLTVLKATSSAPHLTVEVGAAVSAAAGRTQPITVKLAANAPAGHRDETVVLLTDDPDCPELRIPVRVLKRAVGPVTVTPDAVTARFAPGQTEVSTLVQLRSPEGKAFTVAGAEADFPGVGVKFSPGSGPVATVRVTVPEALAKQPGRCNVRVRLGESGGEVSIPVSWTGAKK
ncbi:hypothetical protein GobsT_39360 [Gemmata obscuriglobus]|nr:DUF1573 domain-containing protein [Gemmata obscuriglobus]QEG29147.1 hypothetical protein GobsT_39360 [Gemmata obscuriglobus]VTS07869.1 Uncharacterized protein OS=Isosphaera pallida (strain ATCC 43644 / DSM 9630 / IS1B) GN=Isop_0163 PE=4 SV=1: DUF1573 [Gemmata obscuriglobus UQM 2246]